MKLKKQGLMAFILSLSLVLIVVLTVGLSGRVVPADPLKDPDQLTSVAMKGNSSHARQEEDQEEENSEEENSDEESSEEESSEADPQTEEAAQESSKAEQSQDEHSTDESDASHDNGDDDDGQDGGQKGNGDGENGNGQDDDQEDSRDDGGDDDDNDDGDDTDSGKTPTDEPYIVTNLGSYKIVTQSELPDGLLSFYAYGQGGDNLSVRVNVKKNGESGNGTWLTALDAQNWQYQMTLSSKYCFKIYLYQKNVRLSDPAVYYVTYEATKADEEHPSVGDDPPTIKTNMDRFSDGAVFKNDEFTLRVSARTSPDKDVIYANQIEVRLNGKLVTKDTGGSSPEYNLYFEKPNKGTKKKYTVEILCWDGKGNSTYWKKNIVFEAMADGDDVGQVHFTLDATTVLGEAGVVVDEDFTIKKGDTAADVAAQVLEENGFEIDHAGTLKNGYYLRRVTRGDAFYAVEKNGINQRLWDLIERDSIGLMTDRSDDSLGEFDYTKGSGWMYSVNGTFMERSMSSYVMQDGDDLSVCFTLAYGKDIGGYDSSEPKGLLSSYCGTWANGSYTAGNHKYVESDRKEATASKDGYIEYTCKKCGDSYKETIPAKGGSEGKDESEEETKAQKETGKQEETQKQAESEKQKESGKEKETEQPKESEKETETQKESREEKETEAESESQQDSENQ